MAKPKITRLSDPSNPYGGKKSPTRARTADEKMDAAARSRSAPERPKPKPATPAKKSQYMEARERAINSRIDRADPPRRSKK